MQNLLSNLPHLIMAAVVIGATSALAVSGVITGDTALAVIAGAGGVSLGVGAAAIPVPTAPAPAAKAPPPTTPGV